MKFYHRYCFWAITIFISKSLKKNISMPLKFNNPIKACFTIRKTMNELKHARHKFKTIYF